MDCLKNSSSLRNTLYQKSNFKNISIEPCEKKYVSVSDNLTDKRVKVWVHLLQDWSWKCGLKTNFLTNFWQFTFRCLVEKGANFLTKVKFDKSKFLKTLTGRSLSALGFLQIYRNKRAQQRKFYAYIFSEQLFGENICLEFQLLGTFLVINLKKPHIRKWSTCRS